jgi:hypothetical protein
MRGDTPTPLLQCRGPERRLTWRHLIVAALLIAGFVSAVSVLAIAAPRPTVIASTAR